MLKVTAVTYQYHIGATENAGVENARASKMQDWNRREWNSRHQKAGLENARVEIMAPEYRSGKRERSEYGKPKCT